MPPPIRAKAPPGPLVDGSRTARPAPVSPERLPSFKRLPGPPPRTGRRGDPAGSKAFPASLSGVTAGVLAPDEPSPLRPPAIRLPRADRAPVHHRASPGRRVQDRRVLCRGLRYRRRERTGMRPNRPRRGLSTKITAKSSSAIPFRKRHAAFHDVEGQTVNTHRHDPIFPEPSSKNTPFKASPDHLLKQNSPLVANCTVPP